MTHPPARESILHEDRSACCPEAQADGVPCTELGRSCENCERANASREGAPVDEALEDLGDPWAV